MPKSTGRTGSRARRLARVTAAAQGNPFPQSPHPQAQRGEAGWPGLCCGGGLISRPHPHTRTEHKRFSIETGSNSSSNRSGNRRGAGTRRRAPPAERPGAGGERAEGKRGGGPRGPTQGNDEDSRHSAAATEERRADGRGGKPERSDGAGARADRRQLLSASTIGGDGAGQRSGTPRAMVAGRPAPGPARRPLLPQISAPQVILPQDRGSRHRGRRTGGSRAGHGWRARNRGGSP